MPLTEQQRVELERRGFVVLDGDVLTDPASGREFSIDGALPRAAEAASILGIAPPGYRLVPEGVAEKALPLVQALAEQKRVVAEELIGAEERAEAFEEYRALTALASALQGKEGEKR